MNLNDIKEYVLNVYENRQFSYDYPSDNDMNDYLLENEVVDYITAKKYIESLDNSCFLSSISSRGNSRENRKIYCYNIKQRLVGMQYHIKYKGVEFQVFVVKNEVKLITLWWSEFSYGNSSYGDRIGNFETLEQYYNKAIEIVKQSKRKAMTYYNKEIKELKQMYKRELKRHNDILKFKE